MLYLKLILWLRYLFHLKKGNLEAADVATSLSDVRACPAWSRNIRRFLLHMCADLSSLWQSTPACSSSPLSTFSEDARRSEHYHALVPHHHMDRYQSNALVRVKSQRACAWPRCHLSRRTGVRQCLSIYRRQPPPFNTLVTPYSRHRTCSTQPPSANCSAIASYAYGCSQIVRYTPSSWHATPCMMLLDTRANSGCATGRHHACEQ